MSLIQTNYLRPSLNKLSCEPDVAFVYFERSLSIIAPRDIQYWMTRKSRSPRDSKTFYRFCVIVIAYLWIYRLAWFPPLSFTWRCAGKSHKNAFASDLFRNMREKQSTICSKKKGFLKTMEKAAGAHERMFLIFTNNKYCYSIYKSSLSVHEKLDI